MPEDAKLLYKISKVRPMFFSLGFIVSMIVLGIIGYDVQWYIAAGQGESPSGTPYIGLGDSTSLLVYRIVFAVMIAIIALGITSYLARRHYRKISDRMI